MPGAASLASFSVADGELQRSVRSLCRCRRRRSRRAAWCRVGSVSPRAADSCLSIPIERRLVVGCVEYVSVDLGSLAFLTPAGKAYLDLRLSSPSDASDTSICTDCFSFSFSFFENSSITERLFGAAGFGAPAEVEEVRFDDGSFARLATEAPGFGMFALEEASGSRRAFLICSVIS